MDMFAVNSVPSAVDRWKAAGLPEPPPLLALTIGYVARNLDYVATLDGMPDEINEILCYIASSAHLNK
eukprot:SAG31_NODE_45945_length_256_cov_1.305732_1_plen_67_part_01